ncbi:MAG: hypothetical protein ACK5WR_07310 [Planctomycetaceae bacterium]|jgi:hypothetical protein
MIHRQKTRVVSGCAGLMVLMGAAALSAEMHIQCKKSRCALPARNYTTREPVMGATVTSPLTATISVDQVLPASKSALVPLDELDAQQLADQLRQTPTVVSGNVPVAPLQDLQGLFSRGGRIPASVSGGPQIVPSAELLGTEAELREALRRAEQQNAKLRAAIETARSQVAAPAVVPAVPAAAIVSGNPAVISAEAGIRRSIRSKTFRGGPDVRLPNGIRLEQHLLTIYETGEAAFNGVLWHDGGPYASRQGSKVTITIRAMGATEAYEVGPADGPLFWETRDVRWVPRGKPERIKLTTARSEEIRAHFEEINRLEVNLESPTIR